MAIRYSVTTAHKTELSERAAKIAPIKTVIPAPEHQVRNRPGRKPSTKSKHLLTLRLDPDIIEYFRSTGEGWQTRMNDALRKAMEP